jgi:ABC-type lipoprotein release transport system permease subunit
VVSQGLLLAIFGIAIGWTVAFFSASELAQLLFEVEPSDFATFVLVPLTVAGLATLASSLPALRAAGTDPMVALRSD